MTSLRQAAQQALEALEQIAKYENPQTKIQVRKNDGSSIVTMYPHKVASDAAQALRTALAEPEKPCPYIRGSSEGTHWCALAAHGIKQEEA
jgi:hypothetical protein